MISLERVDVVTSRVYISCICTSSFSQLAFECFMINVKTKLNRGIRITNCSKVRSDTAVGWVLVFDSWVEYHPRNGVWVGVRPRRGTCDWVGPLGWCLG